MNMIPIVTKSFLTLSLVTWLINTEDCSIEFCAHQNFIILYKCYVLRMFMFVSVYNTNVCYNFTHNFVFGLNFTINQSINKLR